MGLILVTPPAVEPITLDEAKDHLRVIGSDENAYIYSLIQAARAKVEDDTRRALISRTYKATLRGFPKGRTILLERPPLITIDAVEYYDEANTLQTLSSDTYRAIYQREPGLLELLDGLSWPDTEKRADAVAITYSAGYGNYEEDVEPQLRHAIKLLVSHWFSLREAALPGVSISSVPYAYDYLTSPFRVPIL